MKRLFTALPVRCRPGWFEKNNKRKASTSQESQKAYGFRGPRKLAKGGGLSHLRPGAASAPHQGRGRFFPPPRPPPRASPRRRLYRGREGSDTWRLGEVDDMAEIRGGALGRNEGRGPKAATSSHARCSPKRAQPGEALQPRAAASLPELVPRQRAAPAAARPSSPNFRNPKPLRARVPPLAWALPLPSSARARAPVPSHPGLASAWASRGWERCP